MEPIDIIPDPNNGAFQVHPVVSGNRIEVMAYDIYAPADCPNFQFCQGDDTLGNPVCFATDPAKASRHEVAQYTGTPICSTDGSDALNLVTLGGGLIASGRVLIRVVPV